MRASARNTPAEPLASAGSSPTTLDKSRMAMPEMRKDQPQMAARKAPAQQSPLSKQASMTGQLASTNRDLASSRDAGALWSRVQREDASVLRIVELDDLLEARLAMTIRHVHE